jgi:hypothetical protein
MAERPCRTRYTAAPPSMRLRSAKLSAVRYRPAVNRFFTNSRKRQKLRWLSIQWLHSGEHRWVNSGERQGLRLLRWFKGPKISLVFAARTRSSVFRLR